MADIDAAAQLLCDLHLEHRTVDALPTDLRPTDIGEGYRIQDRLAALLGHEVVGWKVGATAPELQAALGVTEPFSGRIFATRCQEYPATLLYSDFESPPGIECELGFVMGRDLNPSDGPHDARSIMESVSHWVPCIELVCTRFGRILGLDAPSIVADNSAASHVVLGELVTPKLGASPVDVAATLRINGDVTAKGTAEAVMGNPSEALAWLANHLAGRGITLEEGSVVLTGTMTGLTAMQFDDIAMADFERLGRVSVHVTG